jgi:hypothetical protein
MESEEMTQRGWQLKTAILEINIREERNVLPPTKG